jgi:hypothetical protein
MNPNEVARTIQTYQRFVKSSQEMLRQLPEGHRNAVAGVLLLNEVMADLLTGFAGVLTDQAATPTRTASELGVLVERAGMLLSRGGDAQ